MTFDLLPLDAVMIYLMLIEVIQTQYQFKNFLLICLKFIIEVVHLAFSIIGIHLKIGLIFHNCNIIFLMLVHSDRLVDEAMQFVQVILIQCFCSVIHCLVKLKFNDLGLMNFIGMEFNGALSFYISFGIIIFTIQNSIFKSCLSQIVVVISKITTIFVFILLILFYFFNNLQ